MTERLQGRRIVVTGAASGMGEAIARLFAQEGAKLALLDIDETALTAAGAETGQLTIPTDVSNEASVQAAIAHAAETLGGLDGLVNAAGILARKKVVETDWATFQRVVGVNLAGPFLTCREAMPHLQAAGKSAIVNIASLAGIRSQPSQSVYTATKAGLIAFSESLSAEAGPNVRVNVVCPGIIRTPMTDFLWQDAPDTDALIKKLVQVGRPGEPREIAESVLFLMSDAASFISAATLMVSGGHIH